MNSRPTLGFVGQGYVGKNYADDFERRGYDTVRYALEEPYRANRAAIAGCDIVFIAVPTPTTPSGFDAAAVREALSLVGKDKTAVIKSTIVPGTSAALQAEYPDVLICFSPEFLSEATAARDAANPFLNIVGYALDDTRHREAAERVLGILPSAPRGSTCSATQAELIKYGHNGSGYVEIIFFNLLYDLAQSLGADWAPIEAALQADPFIAGRYAKPVHKSGRGAGGHCFIKDFAALRAAYEQATGDAVGAALFKALEAKNAALLTQSGKDIELLRGVYGDNIPAA